MLCCFFLVPFVPCITNQTSIAVLLNILFIHLNYPFMSFSIIAVDNCDKKLYSLAYASGYDRPITVFPDAPWTWVLNKVLDLMALAREEEVSLF